MSASPMRASRTAPHIHVARRQVIGHATILTDLTSPDQSRLLIESAVVHEVSKAPGSDRPCERLRAQWLNCVQ